MSRNQLALPLPARKSALRWAFPFISNIEEQCDVAPWLTFRRRCFVWPVCPRVGDSIFIRHSMRHVLIFVWFSVILLPCSPQFARKTVHASMVLGFLLWLRSPVLRLVFFFWFRLLSLMYRFSTARCKWFLCTFNCVSTYMPLFHSLLVTLFHSGPYHRTLQIRFFRGFHSDDFVC